ncbi:MAG TPA: hypothetical protein DCX95_00710 [Elusimicrobia bacterium]|nr:hypothetical protein [Elusimicrobiota bacterium]
MKTKSKDGKRKTVNGRRKIFFTLLLLLPFTFYLLPALYSQTKSELYFNSGIDKYVKGDYDDAIALFEQTLSENPDHQKAKNFLVKVLIEATEKQIMMSNFPKAKIYIDRAKIIAPDNGKINELQKVISGGYEKSLKDFSKKEDQNQKTVVMSPTKPSTAKKREPKKSIDESSAAVITTTVPLEPSAQGESAYGGKDKSNLGYILFFIVFFVVVLIFVFLWMRRKAVKNIRKIEELKNQIRLEEEKKYKRELEKIKLEVEKNKQALAENIKIQVAEKKAITKKDAERAHQQLVSAIEEDKLLDTITDSMKSDEYSKEIIQKMIFSIRTIMNVNKDDALNNIKRLSESENARLRYDCVKIIENILTPETLEILIKMFNDSDYGVKRAVITLTNNIYNLSPSGISTVLLTDMKKRLTEEKLKNGWII